ncbi:MAG: histidine triad nucleotide-binding protein [Alphaproteobacteria bacterium]|jgi:histidine triad (HIT) family protein|nr:histidine triad nucleotide-binding protein [Alphaproteobacteria bacterium]PHY01416.1 MAG: histidine triad nucleotide-binding protein [Rhodospirillaceae bacterium]
MTYDDQNIFAKILRGEIPCKKVHEDIHTLAFEDINPHTPVHTLVIPKGKYVSMTDFAAKASDAELAAFNRAILKVVEIKGLQNSGYRLITNNGLNGGQEVPHLHVHVLGGRPLGPMLTRM